MLCKNFYYLGGVLSVGTINILLATIGISLVHRDIG